MFQSVVLLPARVIVKPSTVTPEAWMATAEQPPPIWPTIVGLPVPLRVTDLLTATFSL